MATNETPAFDFSALSVEDAELPARQGAGRQRKVQNNPFLAPVQESYDKGVGKAVTVPNAQCKDAEYLIRQAAADLGIGVRVVFSLDKEAREKAAKNKNVTISFQGKEKRAYKGRKTNGQNAENERVMSPEVASE